MYLISYFLNNKIIQSRQFDLQSKIEFFRKDLIDKHCYPSDLKSPIQIIQTENIDLTITLAERMKMNGIYTKPIFSPTVPQGKECIRICLHSFNTKEEITQLKSLF